MLILFLIFATSDLADLEKHSVSSKVTQDHADQQVCL